MTVPIRAGPFPGRSDRMGARSRGGGPLSRLGDRAYDIARSGAAAGFARDARRRAQAGGQSRDRDRLTVVRAASSRGDRGGARRAGIATHRVVVAAGEGAKSSSPGSSGSARR